MAYKAELQSNNTDLQSILDSLNTMPDALDTSDATAVSSDISTGKTAYVNGEKITGNGEMARDLASEISTQDDLITQIVAALDGKVGVELPVLSNPAGAANIENGYEAIGGSGNKITGTAKVPQAYNFSAYYSSTGSASSGSTFSKYASSYTTTCEVTPQHGDLVALDDLGDSILFVMEASGYTHYIIWNMSGAALNMFDRTITGTLLRNWR